MSFSFGSKILYNINHQLSMPSYYELREMPDMHQTGKKVVYPKFKDIIQVDTKDISKILSADTSFSEADVIGLLKALSDRLATELSRGHSVKLDGVGVFTPSLKFVQEDSENNVLEEDDSKRVELGTINFRPDKHLISSVNSQLDLVKSSYASLRSSKKFSPEERLGLAVEYLKSHSSISVREYQNLTGLRRTTAAIELKKWSDMPESGIKAEGVYTHKRYILG